MSERRRMTGLALAEAMIVTAFVAAAALVVFAALGTAITCQTAGIATELSGGTASVSSCQIQVSSRGRSLGAPAGDVTQSEPGFRAQAKRFVEGVISGLGNQLNDLLDIFTDPVGFVTDLFELGKQLLTDPGGVATALFNEIGIDLKSILGGDAFRTGELVGENVSPATLARALASLGDFAQAGRVTRRGTDCASFVAGTPIWTGTDLVPIEQLERGDSVLARNETSYLNEVRAIEEVMTRRTSTYMNVWLGDERIGVTAEHPFWAQGRGWIAAGQLVVGDVVATANGEQLITAAMHVARTVPVFNFSVSTDHNYFAGTSGVWVHNANGDCLKRSRVWPKHHPFPKYLGGAADQTLKKIPRNLHYRFHASLDKWKGGKYARAKSSAAFKDIDKSEVIRDLTEFYRTADGGVYAKYLDDFLQAVTESGY